ncbi:MAG: hypothetical protein HN704_14605 [Bacteroidetes bacterium]|jgi:hypothetical protein|nr:hypothetical protein [Bacteroidota bacterium]MBT7492828.1 hypothetical protein [Bacteroidota bacterium]
METIDITKLGVVRLESMAYAEMKKIEQAQRNLHAIENQILINKEKEKANPAKSLKQKL